MAGKKILKNLDRKNKSRKDLTSWIGSVGLALAKAGLDPILVGEACAALYSSARARFSPGVIEFSIGQTTLPKLKSSLLPLGFRSAQLRTFKSKSCPYPVIIIPPPLAVGDEVVRATGLIRINGRDFKALTPTDCVRNRLALFYRLGSQKALEEAIAVALKRKINMNEIQRWSEWEWADDKFADFVDFINESKRHSGNK